jgi:hypothetical protein
MSNVLPISILTSEPLPLPAARRSKKKIMLPGTIGTLERSTRYWNEKIPSTLIPIHRRNEKIPSTLTPSHRRLERALETGSMNYQITVRYGSNTQRYLTLTVEAPDAPAALRLAADGIPQDIASQVDLVELRGAPDFQKERPLV